VPSGWGAGHAAAGAAHAAARAVQGHEDLRQDERVMQLFGLVNTMLAHDRTTAERDLSIARYAVIPLSPNSGAAPAGHRPAHKLASSRASAPACGRCACANRG